MMTGGKRPRGEIAVLESAVGRVSVRSRSHLKK
jgi:hypothetical protein